MPSSSSSNNNNNNTYQEDQSKQIAESFVDQFWDNKVGKWHTVSKQQGWGTVLQLSASLGQPTMGIKILAKDDDDEAAGEEEGYYYFRAVDQAIDIIACLGMLKQQHATNENDASWHNTRKKMLVRILVWTEIETFGTMGGRC
jgi:hypothetical protein